MRFRNRGSLSRKSRVMPFRTKTKVLSTLDSNPPLFILPDRNALKPQPPLFQNRDDEDVDDEEEEQQQQFLSRTD